MLKLRMFKKFTALAMTVCLLVAMATPISAAIDPVTAEKNIFMQTMQAKGLSEENVNTLFNMSYDKNEMINMSVSMLQEILGANFGQSTFAAPSATTVTVTGIPDDLGYGSTAVFLTGCGLVAGNFYSANSGTLYESQITKFSNYVFFNATASKMYFLYGEYDSGIGYHRGVDFKASSGANIDIRTAHGGTKKSRNEYGGVLVYDGTYTHSYLHMSNRTAIIDGNAITKGATIGKQSNVGAGGVHMHYEVRSGDSVSLGDPWGATNYNTIPYAQMVKNL